MKITCQACQSKYTIADDKIQGKVAKIRCRKCGATVLVDASAGAQPVNGAAVAVSGETWSVSVAEGDQRSMPLPEVIDAYNTGVITGETYVWKEGMGDWQPLSEVPAIVEALNQAVANGAAPPASSSIAPQAQRLSAAPAAVSGARREPGRNRDLFGRGAGDDEVATSAPSEALSRGAAGGLEAAAGLTGARDEHSVLFSLTALTNNNTSAATSGFGAGSAKNDDSGLIDLNALAQAQQMRPAGDPASAALFAPPSPFMFPAALGTVEPVAAAGEKKKSYLPLIVGGAVAVGAIALAIALLAGDKKKDEAIPVTPVAAAPTSTETAEPTVAPSAAPAMAGDTTADSAASAAKAAPKRPAGGASRPAAAKPASAPAAAAPAAAAPAAPKPKASPCGCAPGDLQCQIRCSATGH